MFENYLKIGWRNVIKNKGYSFINISGLAIGIASSLIIFLIVRHEYSYDNFHKHADRIYRVETTKVEVGEKFPGTPTGVAAALRSDFPSIKEVGDILNVGGKIISIENNKTIDKYKESVAFVENEIFQILDFKWLRGNYLTALKRPGAVVLSESYANKFFHSAANAIGKTIRIDEQDWEVTGIVADPPANTDFPFHIMASYATIRNNDLQHDQQHGGWSDNHHTFILLKEGSSAAEVEQRFPSMVEKYMGKDALKKRAYSLLPLSKIHFDYSFGGRTADLKMLKTLVGVGAFLLMIACANFINLATARGIRRAREVGVRKVLGSYQSQLVQQFLSEAGLVTVLALALSLLIAWLSLPYISQLLAVTIEPNLIFSLPTAIFLLSTLIVTSILAGFYPAIVVSSLNPLGAIKSKIKSKLANGFSLRNSLVVFQFCISLVLIIGTLTIGRQLQLFRNADLGFNHEAVITIEAPGRSLEKFETIRQQLLTSSLIQNVSFSNNSPSSESNWMWTTLYNKGGEVIEINTQMKMVDSHFLNTYNIKLVAGVAFQQGDTIPKGIINEVMATRMGFIDPKDAVGQKVSLGESSFPVIGVVKNFHVNSLHQKIDPTLLVVRPVDFHQAGIKLNPSSVTAENIERAISHVQQVWSSNFPESMFEYKFLDHTLEEAYYKELRTAKLINMATGIAILISCMGLFGLVVFTAEQRIKEIGIRKVLGASVKNIFTLFSLDYIKLILIANIFAWPISWWLLRNWLQSFEFNVGINWWIFIVSAFATFAIAGLTISIQVIKAASANPLKNLRDQ